MKAALVSLFPFFFYFTGVISQSVVMSFHDYGEAVYTSTFAGQVFKTLQAGNRGTYKWPKQYTGVEVPTFEDYIYNFQEISYDDAITTNAGNKFYFVSTVMWNLNAQMTYIINCAAKWVSLKKGGTVYPSLFWSSNWPATCGTTQNSVCVVNNALRSFTPGISLDSNNPWGLPAINWQATMVTAGGFGYGGFSLIDNLGIGTAGVSVAQAANGYDVLGSGYNGISPMGTTGGTCSSITIPAGYTSTCTTLSDSTENWYCLQVAANAYNNNVNSAKPEGKKIVLPGGTWQNL